MFSQTVVKNQNLIMEKKLRMQELEKGKNDKMIYRYGNQLIAEEKMDKKQNMSFNGLLSKNSDWG